MIVSPMEAYEMAYILGDLSESAKKTGEEYIVYRCPVSKQLMWGVYDPMEDAETYDPHSDILITC